MKVKKLFTKKELQKFGELCRDTKEKEILEIIDELEKPDFDLGRTYVWVDELKQKLKGKK